MISARLSSGAKRAGAAARRRVKQRLLRAPAGDAPANASAAVLGDESLWPLLELYADSFELESIGYGTVGDLADSLDNLPGLAIASADMKNLQRCWMVKAILGNVPRGTRILEIGAGEPLVAGVLARLGYEVTVVDPYDGSGNGPREFKLFQAGYPDIRFVRDQFPSAQATGDYAAVYSISVLEHIPLEQIEAVIGGVHELLEAQGGCSIHAVDHVLAGWSADSHRAGLERIVASSGLDLQVLDDVVRRMETDPETYLVSAESHNQWRGALPYSMYAMRRIGSVKLFRRVPGRG